MNLLGKISLKENEKPKILVNTLKKLGSYSKIYIKIKGEQSEKEVLDKVVSNMLVTDGNIPVYIFFEERDELKMLSNQWWTKSSKEQEQKLREVFGKENVKFI